MRQRPKKDSAIRRRSLIPSPEVAPEFVVHHSAGGLDEEAKDLNSITGSFTVTRTKQETEGASD